MLLAAQYVGRLLRPAIAVGLRRDGAPGRLGCSGEGRGDEQLALGRQPPRAARGREQALARRALRRQTPTGEPRQRGHRQSRRSPRPSRAGRGRARPTRHGPRGRAAGPAPGVPPRRSRGPPGRATARPARASRRAPRGPARRCACPTRARAPAADPRGRGSRRRPRPAPGRARRRSGSRSRPTSARRLTWPAVLAASQVATSRASEVTRRPPATAAPLRSSAMASVTGPVTCSFTSPCAGGRAVTRATNSCQADGRSRSRSGAQPQRPGSEPSHSAIMSPSTRGSCGQNGRS